MSHFVLITFACIFIAFSVFVLKETGYLKVFLKVGLICFLCLLVASFIYGLLNRFSFIHGSSPAGLDSAFAYAFLVGAFFGPIVFTVGGFCGVLFSYFKKRKKRPSSGSM